MVKNAYPILKLIRASTGPWLHQVPCLRHFYSYSSLEAIGVHHTTAYRTRITLNCTYCKSVLYREVKRKNPRGNTACVLAQCACEGVVPTCLFNICSSLPPALSARPLIWDWTAPPSKVKACHLACTLFSMETSGTFALSVLISHLLCTTVEPAGRMKTNALLTVVKAQCIQH